MTARPWTLPAATGLAAAEAAVIICGLALGAAAGAPMWILFVAVKFPFCWLAARRSPGAYLGLYVWEVAAVMAALGASGVAVGARLLEIATAAAVVALLVASAPLFPPVRLPTAPPS